MAMFYGEILGTEDKLAAKVEGLMSYCSHGIVLQGSPRIAASYTAMALPVVLLELFHSISHC